MNNDICLSIIIPAYNEEQNLPSTLTDISAYLKDKVYEYELIIVDDGSTDRTVEIALEAAKPFKAFTLLKNQTNHGKGYSLKRGVLAARGRYILFMDADNSTRIDQVEKLMEAINSGSDVAIASRRIPGAQINSSQPLHRIVLGNIYIILSKLILGSSVQDYNCGFKLYKNKAAMTLFSRLTRDDWSFDSELIFLIGRFKLKLKEVPVEWIHHEKTSKVRPIRDGINSFISLVKIRLQAIRGKYD